MSTDLEQLLRAHIAAAAAWRRLMEDCVPVYGAREYSQWRTAEDALAALLGPPQ